MLVVVVVMVMRMTMMMKVKNNQGVVPDNVFYIWRGSDYKTPIWQES